MSDIYHVCLVDPQPLIAEAFENAGYDVLWLRTGGDRFFDLEQALAEHNYTPDMVMQTESLAKRSLLTGLDSVDCPTLFWAIDPHLNGYWQSAYGRLFDIVCSTQQGSVPDLKAQGAPDVRWLPFFGRERGWTDMADRQYDIAFVGRVTEQRPGRKWLVQFLKERGTACNLSIEHNLSYLEMMALYEDARIIPNESIFGEVNFRLFEGASCGSLVLSQDLGDEQASLLEPGREFDTYEHIVELDDKLALYLKNQRLVHAMGLAAQKRIQAEHLPVNRMATLIEYAQSATKTRAVGTAAEKWRTLALVAMWEAGMTSFISPEILSRLQALEQDADVAAAVLHVQATSEMKQFATENINTILGADLYADSPELNLAASMAALAVDHWDGAKAFWYRHLKTVGGRDPGPPSAPEQLLTFWAKDLKRQARIIRGGFPYDVKTHLPATASDCLLRALEYIPEHLPSLRLLDTILRPVFGSVQARVGFLSMLTLHEREDWRLAFEIALANLKSYRLDSGLEELHLARELARSQQQGSIFDRALAARDGSGLLAGRLDGK